MTEMRQSAERQRRTKATQRNAKERALRLRMNAWWQQRYGRRAAKEKIHRARLKAAKQAERSRARARAASEQQQRQALRRIEGGSLTADEVERLGETFMLLEQRMEELKDQFGLEDEDLNLDLGPLGRLM